MFEWVVVVMAPPPRVAVAVDVIFVGKTAVVVVVDVGTAVAVEDAVDGMAVVVDAVVLAVDDLYIVSCEVSAKRQDAGTEKLCLLFQVAKKMRKCGKEEKRAYAMWTQRFERKKARI